MELSIRYLSQALIQENAPRAGVLSKNTLVRRLLRRLYKKSRKRIIRYGLLTANLALLVLVVVFVVHNPKPASVVNQNSLASVSAANVVNPLDQLSSADIAVNVARLTNLPETPSVTNHAQSVNGLLAIVPSDTTIVAKPQVVATPLKSRKDIQTYVTQAGDTISGLAAKFGITSDTIRFSNNIGANTDTLTVGKTLLISPIDGLVYQVKSGDTIDSLASKYHANKDQIIAYNDAEITGLPPVGTNILLPNGTLPVVVASPVISLGFFAATFGSNGYDFGWCTWYVSNRRAEIGRPVPSNLGDAYSWYKLAQRAGLPTGLTPSVGAVAVNEAGDHVMVVEQVNGDGSFWVSEMNSHGQRSIADSTPAGGWDRIDYKLFTSAGYLKFIY